MFADTCVSVVMSVDICASVCVSVYVSGIISIAKLTTSVICADSVELAFFPSFASSCLFLSLFF